LYCHYAPPPLRAIVVVFLKVEALPPSTFTPPELALTNAVVANWFVLVPNAAVGAVGMPVKTGLSREDREAIASETNSVVAIFVLLSPAVGVGELASPVNCGFCIGALVPIAIVIVDAKLASSAIAAANSFRVFNASGAESIIESTYATVA
jgi:hypothetical protein